MFIYCCNLFYFISVNDGLQGKLNFLEKNIEPWATEVEYWTDISKQRIAKLHAQSRITNINRDKKNANVKSKLKSQIISEIGEKKEVSTYKSTFRI